MDLDPQDLPTTQQATQQQTSLFNGFASTGGTIFEQNNFNHHNQNHNQPMQEPHTTFQTTEHYGPINYPVPMPAPPGMLPQQSILTNNVDQSMDCQQLQPQPENSSNEINRPQVDIEIDSLLLQQFSCLGTTDHEDLVNQFQNLLNNQCNKDTARFFLEMSNWNIQTAVCCYLDYSQTTSLPSMKILENSRPTELTQVWKLQNNGSESWPNGCYLMSPSQTKRIEIPALRPSEAFCIHADIPLSSPPIKWRLCTPHGTCFGETIWMIPSNSEDTAADLANRMSQLHTTQQMQPTSTVATTTTMSADNYPQVNVVISVKME